MKCIKYSARGLTQSQTLEPTRNPGPFPYSSSDPLSDGPRGVIHWADDGYGGCHQRQGEGVFRQRRRPCRVSTAVGDDARRDAPARPADYESAIIVMRRDETRGPSRALTPSAASAAASPLPSGAWPPGKADGAGSGGARDDDQGPLPPPAYRAGHWRHCTEERTAVGPRYRSGAPAANIAGGGGD